MDFIFFPLLIVLGSFTSGAICAPTTGEKLVFVRELDDEQSSWKRNLDEDLPQHIPLELATNEGKVHMMLERGYGLKDVNVLLETDGREEVVDLDHKNVAIYTDMDKNAVIKVDRSNGEDKRAYTGSLVHEGKHYELHPLGTPSDPLSDLVARALLDDPSLSSDISAHRLRQVEVSMPGDDSHDFNNAPWQRKDYIDIRNFVKSASSEENDQDGDTLIPNRPKPDIGNDKNPNVNNKDQLERKMQDLLNLLRNKKDKDQERAEVAKEDDLNDDLEDDLEEQKRYKNFFDAAFNSKTTKSRRKRNTPMAYTNPYENYRFTMVIFVDHTMYDHWTKELGYSSSVAKKEIAYFVSHLFNGMSMAFRRISPDDYGFSVTPWLTEIKIFQKKEDTSFLQDAISSDGKLDAQLVSNLLMDYRKKNEKYSWLVTGHVMYLTKYDLAVGAKNTVVGVSPTCSICDPEYGFSIIEVNGFFAHMSMSHELAHNLGASHDDSKENCKATDMYLMTPYDVVLNINNVKNGFQFSSCSIKAMRGCISGRRDGIGKTCMYVDPCDKQQPLTDITRLPGQKYSLDKQCKMFVDKNAVYDKNCDTDPCLKLPCRLGNSCKYGHKELRPVPGTSCGGRKVCMWGECTKSSMKNYHDSSCRKKRATPFNNVPSDCWPDKSTECEAYAMSNPFAFFYDNKFRVYCPTTTYKYGLHFDFVEPCWSNRLDHVTCPYDPKHNIKYSQISDGIQDCDKGVEEIEELIDQFCLKIPFCFDDNMIPDPNDFTKCITISEACQSSKYSKVCAVLTENHF